MSWPIKMVLAAIGMVMNSPIYAQADDCKSIALTVYQQVQERYTSLSKQSQSPVAFSMQVATYYHVAGKKGLTKSTQMIETIMQGQRLFYTDGATEVYQSPGQMVAISLQDRVVYVSNATASSQQQLIPNIGSLRDGIIKEATLSSCDQITLDKRVHRRMRLIPKKAFCIQFNVEYIELIIDERARDIVQYQVVYNSASRISRVQYSMTTDLKKYKRQKLSLAEPFSYVLDGHHVLLPKFAGYQLVDQRKR